MKRLILLGSALLVLASGCNKASTVSSTQPFGIPPTPQTSTSTPPAAQATSSSNAITGIDTSKTTVKWGPITKLSDLGLLTLPKGVNPNDIYQAVYYNIGQITAGPYLGQKIILANDTESDYGNVYFMTNGNSYVLLQKYSANLNTLSAGYKLILNNFTFDTNIDIPDLDYPHQISNPKTGISLTIAYGGIRSELFDPKSQNLSVSFTDNFGDPVYIAPDNSGNPGHEGDYYVKSPDGIELVYIPSFFDSTTDADFTNGSVGGYDAINVTWNDNQKHSFNYIFSNDFVGCSLNIPTPNVVLSDLIPAAHDNYGDTLYEFKANDNTTIELAKQYIQRNNWPAYSPDQILFWADPSNNYKMLVNLQWLDICGG
jgi:hypothetical protein